MAVNTKCWTWIFILFSIITGWFGRSQAQVRNNNNNIGGHSFYNNYNPPPNHFANVRPHHQSHPKYYTNNYYAIQRRPYAATGAQRAVNMVGYHNRVGYISPIQTPYEHGRQPPKVHSIIYANQIGNYGGGPTQRHRPATNYWAEWSTWSKCSKPCNGGVRTRIRICKSTGTNQYDAYSSNAGVVNNCVGYRRGYKACNTQICMTKDQMKNKKHAERKELCAKQNKVVGGVSYKWIPYMRAGLSECKLNCLADGHKMFKSFGYVKDGSMCGHKDGYVCLKGQCKKGKAKNKVLSRPTTSQGGVSGRRQQPNIPTNPHLRSGHTSNKRWVYIKNNILKTNGMSVGYNHVLRLPRGAMNITIRELAPSYNYFALKIGKLFILNGKWPIKSDKLFYAASSTFRYVVTKTSNKMSLEKIFSPGPLADTVDVMVFYNNRSPINITYQYTLQKNQQAVLGVGPPPSKQQPLSGGISHFPPQQLRYRQARLNSAPNFRRYNGRPNNVPYNPAGNNSPFRPNNLPYNPSGGVRGGVYNPRQAASRRFNPHQKTKGYNSIHNNAGGYTSPLLQAKPYIIPQVQQTQQMVHRWQIGGITKCTVKCNGGEQEYIYRCFATTGKNGKFVADTSCHNAAQKPIKKRVCNMQACPVKWVTSQWSRCPTVCGQNSTQHRTAICKEFIEGSKASTHNNAIVDGSKCADLARPKLKRECNVVPCKYNWKVAQWTKCSKTCDFGTQRRYVYCQDTNGKYFGEDKCERSTKPNNTKSCLEAHCTAEWFTSEWGACSSACGSGTQTRQVLCRSSGGLLLAEKLCERNTKPSPMRPCTGKICNGGFWVTSEWSKCSSHCGFGNQYRKVFCAAASGAAFAQVNEQRCPGNSKPSEMKRCENKNCQPLWYTTNWEKCSVTCGRGIKRRQRLCMSDDGKSARGCYYQLRPTLLQFCTKPSCSSKLANGASASRFTSLLKRKFRPSLRVQRVRPNNRRSEITSTTTLPTTTMTSTTVTLTTTNLMTFSTNSSTTTASLQRQEQQQREKRHQEQEIDEHRKRQKVRQQQERVRKQHTESTTKMQSTATTTTTITKFIPTTTKKELTANEPLILSQGGGVRNVNVSAVNPRNIRIEKVETRNPPVIKRYPYQDGGVTSSNVKQVKHVITIQKVNATRFQQPRRSGLFSSSRIQTVNKNNAVTITTTDSRKASSPSRTKRVHVKRVNPNISGDRSKQNIKTTIKKTKVTSNSTQNKALEQCKFDFYSTSYCKIIASRLKLCSLNKFRRSCCVTCRKATSEK